MTTKKDKLEALRKAIADIDVEKSSSAARRATEHAKTATARSVPSSRLAPGESAAPSSSTESSVEEARQKSYDLLSRRPHTIRELRDKLSAREFSRSVIDVVIERLLELRYIQEKDIAERRALQLAKKGKGPLHIRKKLRVAGLSDGDIDAGLAVCEQESNWIERASDWARKRGLDRKLRTTHDRQKLYAKLSRRGYPSSIARSVVFDQLSPETWN